MRRFVTVGPALLVLLTVALTLFAAPSALQQVRFAQIAANVSYASNALEQSDLLERFNKENRLVGEAVLPSVVHVEASNGGRRGPQASGAGWVFDAEGHIVTNAHVVDNAERVRVEFYDGRVRSGVVVGTDLKTDIAVIRLNESEGLFPARRATSEPLYVGDQVFAFGSPFGIKFSMSRGIVSGLSRSEGGFIMGLGRGYTNYIQTDAAINPGNSGGPLVDVNGRVIGMNAAIANNRGSGDDEARQGQSAGIGFAIPLETIENIVGQLIEEEFVVRGYLGVALIPQQAAQLRSFGYEGTGVRISNVVDGQPAADAGLVNNDIIIAIDGRPTPDDDILRAIVSVQEPGSTIELSVFRDRREIIVPVTLGGAVDNGGGLVYIPNSQEMTLDEIRRARRGE